MKTYLFKKMHIFLNGIKNQYEIDYRENQNQANLIESMRSWLTTKDWNTG